MKFSSLVAAGSAALVAASPVPCDEHSSSSVATPTGPVPYGFGTGLPGTGIPFGTGKPSGTGPSIPLATGSSGVNASTPTSPDVAAAAASYDDAATTGFASTNGGTTGGKGGTTTTVSSLAQLTAAASADGAAVIVVSGTIEGAGRSYVTSDKTIIGLAGSKLVGNGLYIKSASNVIVRNLAISKVLAENGDAIGIQASTNVWIDHCDLSSDRDHDKDYYDGLLDVTHACDWVTLSNNYLHDHWKASLVGHSDSNGDEDTGHLTVTYVGNKWENINSRMPSLRFGTGHVYNSYFTNSSDGINTRDGAQVLVQSNVFESVSKPLYSTDAGYAVAENNLLTDSGALDAEVGTITASDLPYDFTVLDVSKVKASVEASAGQTLTF